MAEEAKTPTAGLEKIRELIADQKVAMLTTRDERGELHSRPMWTQQADFDGQLWFFTSRSTRKVRELDEAHEVNVSYSNPDQDAYVSLAGRAELVEDDRKARELWSPAYRAFFPDGLNDPDVALLRVDVSEAEYWDAPSSRMVQVLGFAKGVLTGQRADVGEHARVELDSRGSGASLDA